MLAYMILAMKGLYIILARRNYDNDGSRDPSTNCKYMKNKNNLKKKTEKHKKSEKQHKPDKIMYLIALCAVRRAASVSAYLRHCVTASLLHCVAASLRHCLTAEQVIDNTMYCIIFQPP